MTRRGWPNCSTSASWVWSTMNSALIAKMPATTSTAATTMRSRRSIITSSLTAAQGRHGRRRRLRRLPGAGDRRGSPSGGPLRRHARGSAGASECRQRQIGKHAALALGGLVDDHLIAVLEHLLHGLEVETLEGDVLRRLEGLVDGGETTCVALGA